MELRISIYCSIVPFVKLVPNLYLVEAALYRYILPLNPLVLAESENTEFFSQKSSLKKSVLWKEPCGNVTIIFYVNFIEFWIVILFISQ